MVKVKVKVRRDVERRQPPQEANEGNKAQGRQTVGLWFWVKRVLVNGSKVGQDLFFDSACISKPIKKQIFFCFRSGSQKEEDITG